MAAGHAEAVGLCSHTIEQPHPLVCACPPSPALFLCTSPCWCPLNSPPALDSPPARSELHDKYVRLGERMEALVKEGKVLKSSATAETGAARATVQVGAALGAVGRRQQRLQEVA